MSGRGVRTVATALRHLYPGKEVQTIQMRASEDLICNNLMCENVGDACVCKLARYLENLPKVERIELGDNKLGKLPAALFEVTTLKHLDLSGNDLQALPPAVSQLHNLETLNLSENRIDALPLEIADITSLKQLVLIGNPITEKMDVLVALRGRNAMVDIITE